MRDDGALLAEAFASAGAMIGGPFADYTASEFNVFMGKELE